MLKNYQAQALSCLDRFCNLTQSKPINEAFKEITTHQYLEIEEYSRPYVCVRIPTGGGKTIIGAKALRILVNEYLNKEYHIVFWLAPSDKIVSQTVEALKDKRHFYRQALDKEFDNINVLTLQESYRQKFDPRGELVIIVGTIQSFRANSKDTRKFFEENGNYFELLQNRDILPSLENVMKFYEPIIILDEAHKASTELSLKRLFDLKPSFIFEMTATPVTTTNKAKGIYASNVLYSVSATELKKENMIKLPILLKTLDDSMSILKEGIEKRNYLEELAKLEEISTDRYIRPINLIRAEENRSEESLTYDKIKKKLIEDFGINEEYIAVQTGNLKEIDGADLLSHESKIRYIITVDALKEGWDCPFAYVLTVVSGMESKTAIEQLIGRVLRMPYIEQKEKKELGYSYVYVVSNNFESVANSIGDTLVKSGFEEMEAKISINNSANTNEYVGELGGLFGDSLYANRQFTASKVDLELLLKESTEEYINFNTETKTVTIVKIPTKSKREAFVNSLKKALPNNHAEIEKIIKEIEELSGDKLDEAQDIELPRWMIRLDGEVLEFEESVILEHIEITDKDIIQNANLTLDEFDIDLKGHLGVIDIENNKLKKQDITSGGSLLDIESNEESGKIINEHKINLDGKQVIGKLAVSIAKIIRDEDDEILKVLSSAQLNQYISLTIINLIDKRENIDIYVLISKKYQLKRAILGKLQKLVKSSKKLSFSKLLDLNHFVSNHERMFVFSPSSYKPNPDNRSEEFKKHHYKYVDKFDSNEEYLAAKYIDSLPNVSTWIKNIPRDAENSFWLQTPSDKFYPDFIIKFLDGKILVAESKGAHLRTNDDTKEKEKIGMIWASLYADCEFVMLFDDDYKEKLKICK